MAKYWKYNGMEKVEITDVDSVAITLDDGTEVELQFRKSDKEVSLSVNGSMVILPVASNVARIRVNR